MSISDNQVKRGLVPLARIEDRSSPSNGNIYLVTIKLHAMRHVTKEELDSELQKVVKRLSRAEWGSIVAYESDSLHRMHLHTVVICQRKPYFKKYQTPGVHVHFAGKKDPSYEAILKYITKQPQDGKNVLNRFVANQGYWDQLGNIGLTVPKGTFKISFD